MKVHIMSMGILTIKSTNCVDMYNGNYKFLLLLIIFNVFLIQKIHSIQVYHVYDQKDIKNIFV